MQKDLFFKPTIIAKHRQGILGTHLDCFIDLMQKHGYSQSTMRYNIQRVTHFGNYLAQRGIQTIHNLEGEEGRKLLIDYRSYWEDKGHWGRNHGLKLYLRSLKEAGVLKDTPKYSLFTISQQYIAFLKNQKGLSPSTIRHHQDTIEKFLHMCGYLKEASSPPNFGINELDKFIEQEGAHLKRTSLQVVTGVLRSFVRFLYQTGKINTDLSNLITSPRCYKLASLPQVLSWDEVQQICQSVDLKSKSGYKNYAILVLLSTYGLRAGEVANLKLEDINWRKEKIHIAPSKTGKDLLLPLTAPVGKALIRYLKKSRPSSKYREIFLLSCAPWTPLKSGNISYVVNRHMQYAGINPPRYGAHLLRHSFATHLIRKGVPLKEIGDLLGHRNPESTHTYTKTATEDLRSVALDVPELL